MFQRSKRLTNPDGRRETSLCREVHELELQLDILRKFLRAAPRIREESRYLIPPPDDFVLAAPPRAQPRRA